MKLLVSTFVFVLFTLTLLSQSSNITYQGKLLDNNGIPVNQNGLSLTFAIYDDAVAGTKVWPSSGVVTKSVDVVLGLYSVTLGTGTGNDDIFDFSNLGGQPLYLEVTVSGSPLPRTILTSVPYSILSNQAKGVSNDDNIIIQSTDNNGNITLSPIGTGKVIINNALQFNVGSSLNGKILTSDASGNATWQAAPSFSGESAGGDLTGTYPNPTIATSAVTSSKILDETISNSDIATNAAISYSKLSLTNSIQNGDLVANSITTSKVANGTVTTSKLADSAVSGLKLLTHAVQTAHLADGSVTNSKIANNSVSGSKIALGSDAAGDIIYYDGTDYVRLPKGTDGQYLALSGGIPSWAGLSGGTVNRNTTLSGDGSAGSPLGINLGNSNTWTANQTFGGTFLITANSRIAMTNSDNNARDIRFQEPSGTGSQYIGFRAPSVTNNGNYVFPAVVGSAGQMLSISSTNGIDSASLAWATPSMSGSAGGDLTGTYPNPSIATSAVTTTKILDETILNSDIATNAAIAYSKLSLTNSIQNADLVANSVTTSKVANGTVTTSKMADSAISGLKLLTYAVTDRHILDGAVTTAKIANNSVSGSKISLGSDAAGDIMYYDGTDYVRLPKGTDGEYLTLTSGIPDWAAVSGGTVTHNATLSGDGSAGNPLGINLGNPNTWTSNQTFASTFLITANSRIAMTNSDNNARDIRFQEPSGTGSQYIGLRAPSVSNNGNYVLPAVVGTAGQMLSISTTNGIDSASLAWATPSMTGSAGGDLTGTYPNPSIANSAVNSNKILDETIMNSDIATNAAIAYSKLSLSNSIQNSDIVASSITTSKVANGTVTTSKLADSAVSGLKLLTFAVTNRHLADGSVTPSKISSSAAALNQVISYNGTNVVWASPTLSGSAGGDLTGTYPNPTVAAGAINGSKILDSSITTADISASAAIHYSKLSLSNSIQNSDLVASSVTTSKVANGTVTTSKLADSAVSGLKLLTYAVNNRHLADNSVNGSKIALGSDASGDIMYFDGTDYVRLPKGTDGEYLTLTSGIPDWASVSGVTVNHNATLSGDGSSGNPLGINLGNSNTWTANQTFSSTFLITSNARIAMTNSDNNSRDLRIQEPSGTGSQYIGIRCPNLSNNGNYVWPAVVGQAGYVMTISSTNGIDSASLAWVDPNASDRRLKKDISKLKYGLEDVMKLNPVKYTMISSDKVEIGFIAQEVREVIPEVITGVEGDLELNHTLGVSYNKLTALLTKAIQEQQEEIKSLRKEINKLKNELSSAQQINSTMLEKLVKLTNYLEDLMKENAKFKSASK